MVNKYLECLAVEGNYSKARIGLLLLGIFGFAVFIWLIVLTVELGKVETSCEANNSDIDYESLGCWKNQESENDKKDKAIPSIENDKKAKKFLDGEYKKRENPIEKCAKAANLLGFKVFAIRDGGKCLSSADALTRYQMYGKSTNCTDNGEGGPWGNEVYEISGPSPKPNPTVQPTVKPTPGQPGWYIGKPGKSCTNTCTSQSLKCSKQGLQKHNDDVDSSKNLLELIKKLGGTKIPKKCGGKYGSAPAVPNFSPTTCDFSSPKRELVTFNCNASPSKTKQRLCYCQSS